MSAAVRMFRFPATAHYLFAKYFFGKVAISQSRIILFMKVKNTV